MFRFFVRIEVAKEFVKLFLGEILVAGRWFL